MGSNTLLLSTTLHASKGAAALDFNNLVAVMVERKFYSKDKKEEIKTDFASPALQLLHFLLCSRPKQSNILVSYPSRRVLSPVQRKLLAFLQPWAAPGFNFQPWQQLVMSFNRSQQPPHSTAGTGRQLSFPA
ncbi:hypothetical protein O6P43_001704 [Quillaja saponaria]|uniref:Uncharacterized protein n=1 Tax=Quillaja saponaria TaxID=32244 RepID=A0AAD7KMA3_QUISA|nr:hypothetical protein O6P43_034516 [Quillaja saponaria]KAJ7982599.1 hypothetical protein O6P43_001704 [Quillaja saponaria]